MYKGKLAYSIHCMSDILIVVNVAMLINTVGMGGGWGRGWGVGGGWGGWGMGGGWGIMGQRANCSTNSTDMFSCKVKCEDMVTLIFLDVQAIWINFVQIVNQD